MKKTKKALASLAIAGMLATMVPFNAFAAYTVPDMGTRLAGYTAYDTAQVIAQQTATADSVVLAAGMTRNSVDALAAGPLAAQLKAPILLTDGDGTLTTQAKEELQRLMPKKVYITSGTAVTLPVVLDQVRAITGPDSVVSLGGFDAPETSLNIAKQMVDLGAHPTGIVVAGGWATPADALSAASIASAKGMPILAVAKNGLSAAQKTFINSLTGVMKSYVVGGTAVIDTAVEATLPGVVTRLAGITQYDTNLKILQNFTDVNYDKLFVANGRTFVDALAGAPLVAQYNSAIVLADQVVDSSLVTYVEGKMSATSKVIALGGTAAVPESALSQIVAPAALTVTSVSAINVTTIALTAPVLPATGTATMSDGTSKTVAITWAVPAASSYAVAGTFTVSGTIAESATVKATATVTVTVNQAAADIVAAKTVQDAITALPSTVTLTDKDAVVAARTAFTALTATQQALVTNVAKLVAAENELATLTELALQATAESAVVAYETAPITTLAEVTIAEGLKVSADASVVAVGNVNAKTAFELRVTTRTTAIATVKTTLEAEAVESAKLATATTAVTNLETKSGLDLTVEANLTSAELAVTEATTALTAVDVVNPGKSALVDRLNTASGIITTARTAFDAATALANANASATTELGKVVPTQTAYTDATGLNTDAVYTDVTTARDAVDTAVFSNITADILSTTVTLTSKLSALTAATSTLVDVATANLASAIANEALLTSTNYVDYSAVTTALGMADGTTVEKIAKTVAINTAISNLVTVVDANLQAAKTAEGLLVSTNYVDYSAVVTALALPETTDAEKIAKTTAINDAMAGLVTLVQGEANKITVVSLGTIAVGDLSTVLEKAQALVGVGYTVTVKSADGTKISATGVATEAGAGTIDFTVTEDATPANTVDTVILNITVN